MTTERKTQVFLTKEQVLAIPEMLKTMTMQEISTQYGVSYGTIRTWVRKLRKAGYKIEKIRGQRPMILEIK